MSANFMRKKILSLTRAEKNILKALYALKKLVLVEKAFSAAPQSEKNNFDSEKTHSHLAVTLKLKLKQSCNVDTFELVISVNY